MVEVTEITFGLINGFKAIFTAPFKDINILWLLIPILGIWIFLEITYFYKKEELGWNNILINGLSLFWIGVFLTQYLSQSELSIKLLVPILFIIYGLGITIFAIKQELPEKITMLLTSPTATYYFASIITLWTYNALKINIWVFIDIMILLPVVLGIFFLIKKVLPAGGGGDMGTIGSIEKEPSPPSEDLKDMKL